MAASPETLRRSLENLVQKFQTDKPFYLSKEYSEAQTRVDFVTPFFKALGWDVENQAGLPHHEREVLVERGETEGRPDYNFRIAAQTKFFAEAKSPSGSLADPNHILQANGQAWNVRRVFPIVGLVFSLAWPPLSLSSSGAPFGSIRSGFIPEADFGPNFHHSPI